MAVSAGTIEVKTSIDNSGLEKGLEEAQDKVEKFSKDNDVDLKPKVETEDFDDAKDALSELGDEFANTGAKGASAFSGASTYLSGLTSSAGALIPILGVAVVAITEIGVAFKMIKTTAQGIIKVVKTIGGLFAKATKSAVQWGLSIFGVKDAYSMINQATQQAIQNNEEISNKIAVIKGALATAIEPLVARIVDWVYTLMSMINSLITQLTGKDLFATAKKNLAKGAKSSGEIKNNLQQASFDEQNVLRDNSGGGGGGGQPLAGIDDINQSLLKTLEMYKDMFLRGDYLGLGSAISQAIGGAFDTFADKIKNFDWTGVGKNIGDFLVGVDFSAMFVGLIRVFGEAVIGFQNMLLEIDWGIVFANFSDGLMNAILKINEYINQIRWEDIGVTLTRIFIAIDWAGLGSAILTTIWNVLSGLYDLFISIDWGLVGQVIFEAIHTWLQTLITLFETTDWVEVGKNIGDIVGTFLMNVDWITLLNDILTLIGTILEGSSDFLGGFFDGLKTAIWRYFTEDFDWVKFGQDLMMGLVNGLLFNLRLIFLPLELLLKMILGFFGIHSPSKVFEDMGGNMMEGLVLGIQGLINSVLSVFRTIWNGITTIFSNVGTWFKDKFTGAWNKVKEVFSGVGTFFGGIWDTIKSKFTDIGTKIGEAVSGAFKRVVNVALSTIENVLNTPIRGINKIVDAVAVFGIHLGKLQTFSLPRLAKGGIINQPSRGVMVGGSAIAGERGAEGVIPLTDSQQMAILGEAIGRYVTINANITNTMNGRVISRELQKINNENDFAYNR